MIKICPNCGKDVEYKHPISFRKATKDNSICSKCSAIKRNDNPKVLEHLRNISNSCKGNKNGMFNKRPYDIWLEKYGKEVADKKQKEWLDNVLKTNNSPNNSFKERMSGLTTYEYWCLKEGKKIADEKMIKLKEKQSFNYRGEKNNMYGKPSPTGSGNGWSGWYKGWYFRSLRELTYMIKIIERFNLKWENGESNKYKVSYIDYKGDNRNYYSDFIINYKYMVESKPKKLWTSDGVKRKKEAAIEYCKNKGLKYKLIDAGKITNEEFKIIYESGLVKLLPRYEIKYKELWEKKEKQ